eukprot:TRINITY_DN22980_c0_g1_i1.p1 TRINITY_DN22980_c0_g1~~TRINITY_DN22980_c0_g1_i1.p1  ORF type:complete len:746 (+),score=191.14 TRINITY_DN22980_c0_g1_i1:70-2307(+)
MEASGAVAAPCASAATLPFTPAVINLGLCMARTWNSGSGGQCRRGPLPGAAYCSAHCRNEQWQVHGRVDGPVPPSKLRDFQKAKASGLSATGASGGARPKKVKATKAGPGEEAPGVAAAAGGSDNEGSDLEEVHFDSDSDCEMEFDLATSLRAGSGAIVGAEALTAYLKPAVEVIQPAADARSSAAVRRRLCRQDTPDDPALPDAKRRRLAGKASSTGAAPAKKSAATATSTVDGSTTSRPEPMNLSTTQVEELDALCSEYGVPTAGRSRLQPLFVRWGEERAGQILDLWAALGDGASRPVCASTLHVQGPQGTGKTSLLVDFLNTLGVRSVWLNCASFTSLGELQARLVELLRRSALEAALASDAPELPRELKHRLPQGKQLRALDRLEIGHRSAMDYVQEAGGKRAGVQVVMVFDDAQDLGRLGTNVTELVETLPQVLQHGNRLACVTVSRLPLSAQGLLFWNREPSAVTFPAYTEVEAKGILYKVLLRTLGEDVQLPDRKLLGTVITAGLLKMAAPHLGRGMNELLSVGEELLLDKSFMQKLRAAIGGDSFMSLLQQRVTQAVMSRVSFWDLRNFSGGAQMACEGINTEADAVKASTAAALDQMTNGMKRLALAAYLAARIHRDHDMQYFAPKRLSRKAAQKKSGHARGRGHDSEQPSQTRCPRPAPLTRVLAIYHHLAGQGQLLGDRLFLHLARLREIGLIRLERVTLEHDPKVLCRVELALARACAGELRVDLAEYMVDH